MKRIKRDIAERFAAVEVDPPITQKDANAIIETFLTYLARCEVCDGDGTMEVGHDLMVYVGEVGRGPGELENRLIPAGRLTTCVRCGGRASASTGHDPDHVGWHCFQGQNMDGCQGQKAQALGVAALHRKCGWMVMVPLPDPTT